MWGTHHTVQGGGAVPRHLLTYKFTKSNYIHFCRNKLKLSRLEITPSLKPIEPPSKKTKTVDSVTRRFLILTLSLYTACLPLPILSLVVEKCFMHVSWSNSSQLGFWSTESFLKYLSSAIPSPLALLVWCEWSHTLYLIFFKNGLGSCEICEIEMPRKNPAIQDLPSSVIPIFYTLCPHTHIPSLLQKYLRNWMDASCSFNFLLHHDIIQKLL